MTKEPSGAPEGTNFGVAATFLGAGVESAELGGANWLSDASSTRTVSATRTVAIAKIANTAFSNVEGSYVCDGIFECDGIGRTSSAAKAKSETGTGQIPQPSHWVKSIRPQATASAKAAVAKQPTGPVRGEGALSDSLTTTSPSRRSRAASARSCTRPPPRRDRPRRHRCPRPRPSGPSGCGR